MDGNKMGGGGEGLGEVKKHLTNRTYGVTFSLVQRCCPNYIVGISE